MKKLRVFQAFKTTGSAYGKLPSGSKRRIVPGFFPKNLGTILLFLLMLPYLITSLFGNLGEGKRAVDYPGEEGGSYEGTYFVINTTALGSESVPLEMYVADRLTRSIGEDFEPEAVKAQAVLIRSGLMASLYQSGDALKGKKEITVTDAGYGSMPVSELAASAAAQTKGVCLMYQDQPVNGSYFAVSNGATRNGDELLLTECPYLKSVLCNRDFLAADYASSVRLKFGEFDRLWQEMPPMEETSLLWEAQKEKTEKEKTETELGDISIWRDSVGYVLYLERDGKFVTGEQFRSGFHLASASFHLNEEKGEVMITVKGAGHGLGMSQFAANEMAGEGTDYIGILEYFFTDVTFAKFE